MSLEDANIGLGNDGAEIIGNQSAKLTNTINVLNRTYFLYQNEAIPFLKRALNIANREISSENKQYDAVTDFGEEKGYYAGARIVGDETRYYANARVGGDEDLCDASACVVVEEKEYYAGAAFECSPRARDLPMPPIDWIAASRKNETSC